MNGLSIHLPEEENIVLSAPVVRRLLAADSGDAALLYLALLQCREDPEGEKLRTLLPWPADRLGQAEAALLATGLVSGHRPALQEPADTRPEYTREDVAGQLERDQRFAQLTENVERLLGKKLSTPDLDILLGLYDYLGLPCEVIYLLVSHCMERISARYGPGRRPTMRQIEKDGYRWARLGLMDLESANRYLMQYAGRKSQMGRYMRVLQLGDRAPSPSEERYLLSWAEMDFPPETVELAYDRTILQCKELRWNYLNKILKNWHEKGLRTPEEVAAGDRRRPALPRKDAPAAGSNVERMKKYLEDSRR